MEELVHLTWWLVCATWVVAIVSTIATIVTLVTSGRRWKKLLDAVREAGHGEYH